MGNPAIGRNSDYWKLYAKNPNIGEGAQQRFGVRPQGSEGGIPTTTGHVASNGGFNWHNLDRFDVGLTGGAKNLSFENTGSISTNPFEASVAKTSNGEKYPQYAKYDTIRSPDTRTVETGQNLFCMG